MLTKEQWKQAPTWARYHAFDDDKEAYWYDEKPELSGYDPFWMGMGNKNQRSYILLDENSASWKETLEPRPFDTYPCPFCGGTNLLMEQDFGFYRVECQTDNPTPCTSGPIRLTEEEAWQAWATRI